VLDIYFAIFLFWYFEVTTAHYPLELQRLLAYQFDAVLVSEP
jgi:hypothetical protein